MNPAVKQRPAVWAARVTCVLVTALVVAAIVVNFLPGQAQPLSLRIADGLFTAAAIPFAVVGALIVSHRPANRLGGLLLVGALALGVEKLAQELVRYGVDHPGAVPGLEWIGWVSNWAWVPAILIILPLLPVLFPDGRPLSPRWRPLVWVIVAGALLSLVGSALIPVIGDAPSLRNPLGLSGAAGTMLEQTLIKLFVGLPVAAVAAAVSLIVRFRRAWGWSASS